MRFTKCRIEWLDDLSTIFGPVERGCLNLTGVSPDARLTLYEYDARGERKVYDNMVNASFETDREGRVTISGDSLRAEAAFTAGNGQARVLVTPAAGCKGCGR
jgi:hypothetical protein